MTDEARLRKLALKGVAWKLAHENVGLYPAKVIGGDKPYEERTERMEGWNDCAMEHTDKYVAIRGWLEELPEEHKTTIENFLFDGIMQLYFGKGKTVHMSVDCSDLFAWGCSDCEEIEVSELADLQKAIDDAAAVGADSNGELLWVARKRGMRPQGAYYAHVAPGLAKLFDTCGELREAGLGNPVASSFEAGEKYRERREKDREQAQ